MNKSDVTFLDFEMKAIGLYPEFLVFLFLMITQTAPSTAIKCNGR